MGMFGNYSSGITGTCLGCPDRYPACHDSCERYPIAKNEWDDKRNRIREEKKKTRVFAEYKVSKIIRERKKGE